MKNCMRMGYLNASWRPKPPYASRWYHRSSSSALQNMHTLAAEDMQPVSSTEIRSYLNSMSISFTEGFTCYVTTCPRHCRRRIKVNELDRLYINCTTGYFVCHSCKKSGSWSVFQGFSSQMIELINQKKRLPAECFESTELDAVLRERKRAADIYNSSVAIDTVNEDIQMRLAGQFGIQLLNVETLKLYGVHITSDGSSLVLPLFNFAGDLMGVKLLECKLVAADPNSSVNKTKLETRTIPRVDFDGLFGWNTVRPNHKEVVITSNEFDAMAVHQQTGMLAVSLPKGHSVLPQKLLPQLEQFNKVILWFGGDQQTWQSVRQFAHKMNGKRCFLIRPDGSHPNALQALNSSLSFNDIMKSAKVMQHKSIVTFRSLRYDVLAMVENVERTSGIKWKKYPVLNTLLKGHRRGELTVFTGPTGSGKTTFISDYSLDLCQQGVNTLWGSFEINNARLVKTMLTQYAQFNLSKNLHRFDELADKFEQLPMYFMTFHGQENIRKVIETMSHAVYVHDITHVIVDNLQFMLGVDAASPSAAVDRFYRQDVVISLFRSFATNMNCHVTLVIHPRKEREADDLTVSSIFGSAKVSQEADNILILQDRRLTSLRGRKFVQIAKNRYDGELGIMLLKFDKETLSFSVKTTKDIVKDSDATIAAEK